MKYIQCNKCGCDVYWDTNRHGKKYLAQRQSREYEDGTGSWKEPHYCQATPAEAANYQARLESERLEQEYRDQEAIRNGEIVKGQTVKVYRGRKVPQGTIGVVFWVAEEADAYDVWKIGIKDEAGIKYFLAMNNVNFYFDGADELNERRVAEAKAEAKARRKAMKEVIDPNDEGDI